MVVTLKLVLIGSSGVGKTSLRSRYISGRFQGGAYRATIGADFITKSLPHPTIPDELVMLQIWDTAGQERFSSLSSAFFRGADAALLMFDVNQAQTLEALTKWWQEFCDRAPLQDEDMQDFCCVVVGNKIDLRSNSSDPVTEAEARTFLRRLIPLSPRPQSPTFFNSSEDLLTSDEEDLLSSSEHTVRLPQRLELVQDPVSPTSPVPLLEPSRTGSITINPVPSNKLPHRTPSQSPKRFSKSHSTRASYNGTVTSTHTALTIYHTPSSSFFDSFQSARSSPEPWSPSGPSSLPSEASSALKRLKATSSRSLSSASTNTITPHRRPDRLITSSRTEVPEQGPKLFFTSAMTGEGVSDVFEYIARRVVTRWQYQEQQEARKLHMRDASGLQTVNLGADKKAEWNRCC